MRQRSRRACAVAQCAPAVSDSQGNRLDTAVSDSQGNRLVRDTGRASTPPCLQPCAMRVCTLMYMRLRLYLPAAGGGAPCRTPSRRRRGRRGVAAAPAQGRCPCGDIRGLWASESGRLGSESGRLGCLPRCPRLLHRPRISAGPAGVRVTPRVPWRPGPPGDGAGAPKGTTLPERK